MLFIAYADWIGEGENLKHKNIMKKILLILVFIFAVAISGVKAANNTWEVVNQYGVVIESGNGEVPQYVFDKYVIASQNTDGGIIHIVVIDDEED